MRVKLEDLWKYDGCVVHITEEIAEEYVPSGFYTFLYRDGNDYSLSLLGQDMTIYHLSEYEDDIEILVTNTDTDSRVNSIIEGHIIQALGLIKDGWTCKNQGQLGLDLTPYMEQLEAYITLRNTINTKD